MSKKNIKMVSASTLHNVEVRESLADRILKEKRGVLILENNGHQYQKGDRIMFNVIEDNIHLECVSHDLRRQLYVVTNVYSGRGIEPGYVVLLIDYGGPICEEV